MQPLPYALDKALDAHNTPGTTHQKVHCKLCFSVPKEILAAVSKPVKTSNHHN